jgi:TPR repeat protein
MVDSPLERLRASALASIESGNKYLEGDGVEHDTETALMLFRQASVQYDWSGAAAYLLGYMLEEGNGVEEDGAMAVKYFQIAVGRYNGDAAFDLALMNEWGQGVPENTTEAVRLNILSLRFGSDLVILRADEDLDLEPFPDDVAEGIQVALQNLGLYAGAIDGDLGRASQAAMRALCGCGA